jgi:hypothetical protein
MGWLTADATLKPDERELWRTKARLSLPTAAVRGTLHVTSKRLIHVPDRFTRKRTREVRDWPLQRVVSVVGAHSREHTTYRETTPYAGSPRKRLHVRLDDGTTLLFLVEHRDEAVERLQGVVAGRAATSGASR